jgi:hypothetical protein
VPGSLVYGFIKRHPPIFEWRAYIKQVKGYVFVLIRTVGLRLNGGERLAGQGQWRSEPASGAMGSAC